jgi:hypothetical protein
MTQSALVSRDSSTATEVITSNSFGDATTSTVIRFAQAYAFYQSTRGKAGLEWLKEQLVADISAIELAR